MPRPRVTENYTGSAIGALIGGILGGPVGAAAAGVGIGALVGTAANPTRPLPLETALVNFVASRGLTFGGMERRTWNSVRVVFGRGAGYFYVDARIAPERALYPNVDASEDALYDAAVREITGLAATHGLG